MFLKSMNQGDGNTQLVNAISGKCISTNIQYFITVEDLKRFITQQWLIPREEIFILLPYGTKFKKSNFHDMVSEAKKAHGGGKKPYRRDNINELYVFDRRLFDGAHEDVQSLLGVTGRHDEMTFVKPLVSPLLDVEIMNENDGDCCYRNAVSLLTTNLGWLSALEIDVHYFHDFLRDWIEQSKSMGKCLSVVLQYLELYSFDVEKIYNSNVEFVNNIHSHGAANSWRSRYRDSLEKIDAVGREGKLSQFLSFKRLVETSEKLKELDHTLNQKFIQFRKVLSDTYESRTRISLKIQEMSQRYHEDPSNYELEDQILSNFKELAQRVKDDTHAVIDQDLEESDQRMGESPLTLIKELKSSTLPTIYTIALSLFTQASKCNESKSALKHEMVVLLGDIASTQVQIVNLKNSLLKDITKGTQNLQSFELALSKVDDLPIVYGLYLIELYRRDNWFDEVDKYYRDHHQELQGIIQKEMAYRDKWLSDFLSFTDIFKWDDDKLQLPSVFLKGSTGESKKRIKITIDMIEEYISTLSKQNFSEDSLNLLRTNLDEICKSPNILGNLGACLPSSINSEGSSQELIKGYKNRIKKLESLLHNTHFSNVNSWPSGIFNNSTLNAFQNNIASINEKLMISEYRDKDSASANISKSVERELHAQVYDLQKQLETAKEENKRIQRQWKSSRAKLLNGEDERKAYKETLSMLNAELSNLISKQENQKAEVMKLNQEFKIKLEVITKDNNRLLNDVESWKGKYNGLNNIKEDLLTNLATMENRFVKERSKFDEEIGKLQGDIDELNSINQEAVVGSPTGTELVQEETLNVKNLKEVNKRLEADIYDIFASTVVILENIGLLLSRDQDYNLQITRVKGLRKRMDQSIVNDSALLNPLMVKSSVFQEMKDLYNSIKTNQRTEDHQKLVAFLEQLYSQKLFQSSVIKRFTDVETLAKKLRKENKAKKIIIEKNSKDRITFRNLKVGDIALFLPTRGPVGSMASSISSLNSSFSSVDLSTPPPGTQSMSKTATCKTARTKSTPWAAFTASELGVRYFLKDSDDLVKGKEWFVGKIRNMEKHTVTDEAHNPYKLPDGAVWYEVVAGFLEDN
ncbi:autophagy protein ATG11 Ecym_7456 [Eremothecium cymbalariae DBVPG|uniref:Autophagy-related protein 11 n=1 Tax=Eremothecium cymbalariae (strain CBS 270.75 / DBVPG 7215 / KCTC 17166 / NRRL Y-17582) TaxID=931890 RepID=G8JWR0_ERECY|nr:hypothetical protein Ecym_7456 [Eremothecium cymbalariae DBVPG\